MKSTLFQSELGWIELSVSSQIQCFWMYHSWNLVKVVVYHFAYAISQEHKSKTIPWENNSMFKTFILFMFVHPS